MTENSDLNIEIIELPYKHYGGAWKVAYADFVTAMMAFFLLMWLLNVTTQEQKDLLSDYFNPSHPQISDSTSGAGGVMGGLTMSPEGAMASNKSPLIPLQVNQQRKRGAEAKSKVNQVKEKAEQKRFEMAAKKIAQAIQENPKLLKLKDNLIIDITPEGLRIQIVDQEDESMFPSGSAQMYEKMEELLTLITDIVLDMPNEISIRGHTDAVRYSPGAKYTNWELSADRANSSRRVMLETGMPIDRLNNVMGKASREPLIVDNPLDPRNRRITLILLKESLTSPAPDEDMEDGEFIEDEDSNIIIDEPEIRNPYRVTPGIVEFP